MSSIACVLVHYRYREDTLACIESLRQSGLQDFHLFLVNNDPNDHSGTELEVALRGTGCPFTYLESSENGGFSGGANLGLRAALEQGLDSILLLNNDAIVPHSFTTEVKAEIARYPEEVLTGVVIDDTSGQPSFSIGRFSFWTGQVRHIFVANTIEKINFISGTLMIVPAQVLRRAGLFDERFFMYCEDADLCWRFREQGVKMRFCFTIVIRHRTSSATKKAKIPLQYYRIRNQTFMIFRRGSLLQRVLYGFYLPGLIVHKMFFHSEIFHQAVKGAWDGIVGNMGRRHVEFPKVVL